MLSKVTRGAAVPFPPFLEERVYMRQFTKLGGLPADLLRWQPTVDAMLRDVPGNPVAFLMVDQAIVRGSRTHRRPGVHIDGYWHGGTHAHVLQAHGPSISPGHGAGPRRAPGHGGNAPSHRSAPARIGHGGMPLPGGHGDRLPESPGHGSFGLSEGLIIASDVLGCRAYVGDFDLPDWNGGDCDSVDVSRLRAVDMLPGFAWAGETGSLLHESIPVAGDCERTVVRLNVVNWRL